MATWEPYPVVLGGRYPGVKIRKPREFAEKLIQISHGYPNEVPILITLWDL